jgi:hypothetical protein
MFRFANGTWTQIGGDIVGSSPGVGEGGFKNDFGDHTISLSGDGTILTTIQSGYGSGSEFMHVYKYDAGTANWSRKTTMALTGNTLNRPRAAVISGDGRTIVVSDRTLRMYYSNDGGVTWTQRGTSIVDPSNGTRPDSGGFSTAISISANGRTVLAATDPMNANGTPAQLLCYEWNGSEWTSNGFLREFGWGSRQSAVLSADGNVAVLMFSAPAPNEPLSRFYRYTKNGSGIWTLNPVVYIGFPWVNTMELPYELWNSMSISSDGTLLAVTRPVYNAFQDWIDTDFGDVEIFRWNGSQYVPVIDNRTITNRTGSRYANFNVIFSSDGTRFATGGNGKVNVYDLDVTCKITYSSSNPNVASLYGHLVVMNATGSSTITGVQSETIATRSSVLTVI